MALVPFFLEVDGDILPTLYGGAARGCVGIPQEERVIAVHVCQQSATTYRNCPHPPSKAYNLSEALAAKV